MLKDLQGLWPATSCIHALKYIGMYNSISFPVDDEHDSVLFLDSVSNRFDVCHSFTSSAGGTLADREHCTRKLGRVRKPATGGLAWSRRQVCCAPFRLMLLCS